VAACRAPVASRACSTTSCRTARTQAIACPAPAPSTTMRVMGSGAGRAVMLRRGGLGLLANAARRCW
jgi:hypothetical protein